MTRPLAIFGGTFDPIHNAHLRVAWEAAEILDADVRLLPANVPPHRGQPVGSARQRAALVRAAMVGQERLVLDTRELQREGPSYTIDTLVELREEAVHFFAVPQRRMVEPQHDLFGRGVTFRPILLEKMQQLL